MVCRDSWKPMQHIMLIFWEKVDKILLYCVGNNVPICVISGHDTCTLLHVNAVIEEKGKSNHF